MNLKIKKILKIVHLWIGLISGVLVIIICISGSIYTFRQEIKLAFLPYYTVNNIRSEKLDLSDLISTYESQSPNKVLSIYDFVDPNRTTILRTSRNSKYFESFINPYTGVIIKENDSSKDFFRFILRIHRNLLLDRKVGRQVVGYTVIIFIVSLLTGLILWFPINLKMFKSERGRKAKFTIKKTKNKKRLIYDLHSVLGLYATPALLIIAITGLSWTFSWVNYSLYRMITFEKKVKSSPFVIQKSKLSYCAIDIAKCQMEYHQKGKNLFLYRLPKNETSPLRVSSYIDDGSRTSTDHFYIHPNTGAKLKSDLSADRKIGKKLQSLYYDIHTGSLLGIWGKVLVFMTGLLGASFPITGFMLWKNSKRK